MTRGNQSEKVVLEVTDETSELVYANGIDATTGGYLLPPMPAGRDRRAGAAPGSRRRPARSAHEGDRRVGRTSRPAVRRRSREPRAGGLGRRVRRRGGPAGEGRARAVARAAERPGDRCRPAEGARLRRRRVAPALARPPRRRRRQRRPDARALLPPRRRLPREDPVRLLPGAVGRVRGRAAVVRHAGGVRGVRRERGRGRVERARAALAAGDVLLARATRSIRRRS